MSILNRRVRIRYRVYGEVQAVGFRYRARQTAMKLGLTGWVKNEFDGSVLMEVQGKPASVRNFPVLVQQASRWVEIDESRTEMKEIPLVDGEEEFRIV